MKGVNKELIFNALCFCRVTGEGIPSRGVR